MANIVLIHGAYQGGWIWRDVASRLRDRGHNVLAPTLDGCGERASALRPGITTETHGAEIANLLFYEDLKDVVLAGTSSGGMVMAAAAERARERISRIVFADALALMDGERIRDIVTRPSKIENELGLGPDRDDWSDDFLRIYQKPQETGQQIAAHCTLAHVFMNLSGLRIFGIKLGMLTCSIAPKLKILERRISVGRLMLLMPVGMFSKQIITQC